MIFQIHNSVREGSPSYALKIRLILLCLAQSGLGVVSEKGRGLDKITHSVPSSAQGLCFQDILYTTKEIQVREQGIISKGLWAFHPQGSICFYSPHKLSLCQSILIKRDDQNLSRTVIVCFQVIKMNPCIVFKGTCSSRNLYKLNDKQVRPKIGKIKLHLLIFGLRAETMGQRSGLLV